MRIIFTLFIILCAHSIFAQSVTNVLATQDGDLAIINYNLSSEEAYSFHVSLYYSLDSGRTYSDKLLKVSGDVNGGVKPGNNKTISWELKEEAGELSSAIVFKVHAERLSSLPEPITAELGTISLDEVYQKNDSLYINFTFDPDFTDSLVFLSISEPPLIKNKNGKAYEPVYGWFASTRLNKNMLVKNARAQQNFTTRNLLVFKVDDNIDYLSNFYLKINRKGNWPSVYHFKDIYLR